MIKLNWPAWHARPLGAVPVGGVSETRPRWKTRHLAWHWLVCLGTMTAKEIKFVCECSESQAQRIMQELCDRELAVYALERKTVCIKVNKSQA